MIKKCIYKVFFKENFINDMLTKGWEPVQFKNLGCCIFSQCVPGKYNCKLVFMNRKDKTDYERLYNQIEAIKNNKDIKVIPLKDADPTVNFYYIIYGKEKKLEDEFNVYGDPYGINKDRKTLAISICFWIFYEAFNTRLLLLHLDYTPILLLYILGIGICGGIIITIMDIRHFLIARYIYIKNF